VFAILFIQEKVPEDTLSTLMDANTLEHNYLVTIEIPLMCVLHLVLILEH